MLEMSEGDRCRVVLANVRTMADEIEEPLTIGALHGFGRTLGRLTDIAERMEAAVTAAADASGAVSANSAQGVAAELAELAEQDRREQERQRAEAFASYDMVAERAKLIRMAGGVPPEERRAQRREQCREWGRKGARVAAAKRRRAELAEAGEG